MTATLFKEWLLKLNNKMKAQKRKILFFVDNCAAHPKMEMSNVKPQFLPPNTTSTLQPLDAGIISTFKALYRKRFLQHLVAAIDEASAAVELVKSVTLLDTVRWLDLVWEGVKATTISKCFTHCGFSNSNKKKTKGSSFTTKSPVVSC